MKISLITVCYNAENTIENTILSVLNQDYENIEYILIDGFSSDRTMKIVNKYIDRISFIISEKDLGMYDAINKGIKISTGDVIGILNSDDVFASDNILSLVSYSFCNNNINSLIGDINFINESRIIRHYSSKKWLPSKLAYGFMPPHPSFYCRRDLFYKYGFYRTDFDIAADYELLIRFLYLNKISFYYLNIVMVNMKMGGKSTRGFKSLKKINSEILRALKINSIKTNYLKLYSRYIFKIFEFLN